MLPFVDEFHRFIRKELQVLYDGEGENLSDVFDVATVRKSLQQHQKELTNECLANKALQDKFRLCAKLMKSREKPESDDTSVFDRTNRRGSGGGGAFE